MREVGTRRITMLLNLRRWSRTGVRFEGRTRCRGSRRLRLMTRLTLWRLRWDIRRWRGLWSSRFISGWTWRKWLGSDSCDRLRPMLRRLVLMELKRVVALVCLVIVILLRLLFVMTRRIRRLVR